jgi:nucleotide-binding universal stress UspA family protein
MRASVHRAAAVVGARPERSYRRIVVYLGEDADRDRALQVACRLVAEKASAVIVAVATIELSRELPLGAHALEAELRAHGLLRRARAVAGSFGIRVVERMVRTHGAAEAILAEAERWHADAIVLSSRHNRRRPFIDETAQAVLRRAPCRVLLLAPPGSPSGS